MSMPARAAGALLAALCAQTPAWADPAQMAQGKALFLTGATPACAICHALKDAGSEGAVGPSLDEIKPDAQRVTNALRNGVGNMPSFKGTLTEAQIQAIALYVSTATRR